MYHITHNSSPRVIPGTGGSSTNLAAIWRYTNFGVGQTAGAAPVDSWIGSVGGSYQISNSVGDAGPTSLALAALAGNTNFGYYLQMTANAVPGDSLWYSVRTFAPTGYNYTATPYLKFLRYHTFTTPTGNSGNNGGYDDIYHDNDGHFHFIYEGESVNENFAGGSTAFAPVNNVWETWDYRVVFGTVPLSSGGTADVYFWKNKVLIGRLQDRITMLGSGYSCREIHHSTYWNGGASQNQTLYIGRYAVAAKIAGLRDDTPFLNTDTNGYPLIALNY